MQLLLSCSRNQTTPRTSDAGSRSAGLRLVLRHLALQLLLCIRCLALAGGQLALKGSNLSGAARGGACRLLGVVRPGTRSSPGCTNCNLPRLPPSIYQPQRAV